MFSLLGRSAVARQGMPGIALFSRTFRHGYSVRLESRAGQDQARTGRSGIIAAQNPAKFPARIKA
jgi:hypothetical protein